MKGKHITISYENNIPSIIDVECNIIDDRGVNVLVLRSKCGFRTHQTRIVINDEPTMEMVSRLSNEFVKNLELNMIESHPPSIKSIHDKASKVVPLNPYRDQVH